jgi:hypothetical protein
MSEQIPPVPAGEPAMMESSMPWYKVWITAVTKPKEETYAMLASQPGAEAKKAYLWVFLTSLVTSIAVAIVQRAGLNSAMSQAFGQSGNYGSGPSIGASILSFLCGAPLGALFSVLIFMLVVAIIQWVAKMFGGSGDFNRLAYVFGAIGAPVSLVSAVLSLFALIPVVGICTGLISVLLFFYVLYLEIAAVKAINGFGWGAAIGSVLLPFVVLFILCVCVVAILSIVLGAVLGPQIQDIFNQINQNIGSF